MRLTFSQLTSVITQPAFSLKPKARLRIASEPQPFIPPNLRLKGDDLSGLQSEVLFVEAPAAVGKTTIAKALSSNTGAPLLDLSQVPVSTQSLVGLLQADFFGEGNSIEAFHNGELPIIVDALDEGQLLSGEQSFERFLETTGELLEESQSREHSSSPKLIFLGRPDSIALAKVGLEIGAGSLSAAALDVDYLNEDAARKLVDEYAQAAAAEDAAFWRHPQPVHALVDAYFASIEAALGLERGYMWASQRGRAFAGYAPVLAALGSILARVDNFQEVRTKLESQGTQEAWSVIESVFTAILEREQQKLVEKLEKQVSTDVPPEAYDVEEQLTLLSRLIHGKSPAWSGRVQLEGSDLLTYHKMVEQYLPEHPFVRQGEPANAVLGSMILAHAVHYDLLRKDDLTLLGRTSRQPFLWRSLKRRLETDPGLIDGRYLGFALNSFWNDPIRSQSTVTIRSRADEAAGRASIPYEEDHPDTSIDFTLPLRLFGQVRNSDLDINGELEIQGQAVKNGTSTFFFSERNSLICADLTVNANILRFEGETWLEAGEVTAPAQLDLYLKGNARVGWAGLVRDTYPWNQIPSTVDPPYSVPPADILESLVVECQHRLPAGATITLRGEDYSNPDDDRLRWTDRQFPSEFPKLIKLLLHHKLASEDSMSASGEQKVRIRFNLSWEELYQALTGSHADAKYRDFAQAAREEIPA